MFDLKKNPETIMRIGSRLRDAMTAIEINGRHLTVVVDDDERLIGIVSDGDIRRALLDGASPDDLIDEYLQPSPRTASSSADPSGIRELFRGSYINAFPVVDDDMRPVAICHFRDVSKARSDIATPSRIAKAVIMAGGEGKRLRPLTASKPKPMVEVAGRPVIDHLVQQLTHSGVENLHVAINYLGDKIKTHLGDGSRYGTQIDYLEENEKLGTAGALSLLESAPDGPLLVINGDILTTFDFDQMLSFHRASGSALTVGVAEYHIPVPYGVFSIEKGRITGLREKPETRVHINAGVYLLEPEILSLIPNDQYYDMTSVIDDALERGLIVVPFLIHEDWIDIGNPTDLERAHALFHEK